jgi:hypothetical protein
MNTTISPNRTQQTHTPQPGNKAPNKPDSSKQQKQTGFPTKHTFSHKSSAGNWQKMGGTITNGSPNKSARGYSPEQKLARGASQLANKLGINKMARGSASGRVAAASWSGEGQVSGEWGNASGSCSVALLEVHASASGEAGIEGGSLVARGHAAAGVNVLRVNARGQVNLGNGALKANGQADLYVGANGEVYGTAKLGPDGFKLQAGGKAFAGVEAKVSGRIETGVGIGAAGAIGVKAGIGIEGKLDVSLEKGKLHFKFDFGVALGIGIKIELEFTIDFNKLGKAIGDFFSNLFGGKDGSKQIDLGPMLQMLQQSNQQAFQDFMQTLQQVVPKDANTQPGNTQPGSTQPTQPTTPPTKSSTPA